MYFLNDAGEWCYIMTVARINVLCSKSSVTVVFMRSSRNGCIA